MSGSGEGDIQAGICLNRKTGIKSGKLGRNASAVIIICHDAKRDKTRSKRVSCLRKSPREGYSLPGAWPTSQGDADMTDDTPVSAPTAPIKPLNRSQEIAAIFAGVSDEQLRELYCVQCIPPAEIGKLFGVTYPTVVRQLRLRGIPVRNTAESRAASKAAGRYSEAVRKQWEGNDARKSEMSIAKRGRIVSEETKAKLSDRVFTDEWREKLRVSQTGKKHTPETIAKISAWGIGRPGLNTGKRYPNRYGTKNAHLTDYFKARSANACRFLGFLFADGNIIRRRNTYGISVTQHQRDAEMIRQYLDDMRIRLPLAEGINSSGNRYVQVQFCDRALGEYLIETCGMVPRKSYVDPPFPNLSDEDLPHFAAGHFEGDGSVGVYNNTLYVRIVGSKQFMIGLSAALSRLLGIPYKEPRFQGSVYLIGWSKLSEVRKLYNCFYPDGDYVYMPRKRQTFEDFFASVSKYVFTDEHRAKLSDAGKLRMRTDENRARTASINQGRVISAETRAKLSAAAKGRKRKRPE